MHWGALRRLSRKIDLRASQRWTDAGVSASRCTTHKTPSERSYTVTFLTSRTFWTRNHVRRILPGLNCKGTGLLLSGPNSSLQIKVNFVHFWEPKHLESGGENERRNPLSPGRRFHSLGWFGLIRQLLVSFHGFPSLWSSWFPFPTGLRACPHSLNTKVPSNMTHCLLLYKQLFTQLKAEGSKTVSFKLSPWYQKMNWNQTAPINSLPSFFF